MRRVFIVGDSLFTAGITQTLTNSDVIEVIASASTLEMALPLIKTECPDAVIVTASSVSATANLGSILATYPNLPIIHADPGADSVQVITSQRVGTRSSDLLAAIAALPKQNSV